MSEHITHIAVYDDTVLLLKNSAYVSQALVQCSAQEYDCGWVTSGSNGNHLWAVPILEKYRDKYNTTDHSREVVQKISAAIGWITHRAADLVVKPILSVVKNEKHPDFNEQEQSAYYDMVAYRGVFDEGKYSPSPLEPISPASFEPEMKSHPAAGILDLPTLEVATSHYYMAVLLSNHQPDSKNKSADAWFDNIMQTRQKYTEDLTMYFSAYGNPDAKKTKKYLQLFNYYNPEDEIIRLAKSIRQGTPDQLIKLRTAIDTAANQSMYARMLANSCTMLWYAGQFFEYKIEKDELYDVLNIVKSQRI